MGFASFVDFVYNVLSDLIAFTSSVFGFMNFEVDLGQYGTYTIYGLIFGVGIVVYFEIAITKWLLNIIK